MLNDTNELTMTNTNGIITARTAGEVGENTIAITDKNGTVKRLKVTVPYQYGNKVFGYECNTEGVEWRLFHADDNNIYLIADDYIPYDNLPTSTEGTPLNSVSNYNYRAYFTDILNDYIGSSWIKENTDPKAQKWLSKYLSEYPESENINIKAVAYMMDTNKWGEKFKGEKAEYAIGGPTLELFCASYKVTHPDRYVECGSTNSYGYQVKWSDGSYANDISGLTKDDFESIYRKSNNSKADGMWLASPSAGGTDDVMYANCSGYMGNYSYRGTYLGFRPLVCLKSNIQLVDNGDNTYSIKEQITAKAEYNRNTNQIEVRVAYSDNEISKIMLNDTNELQMTNTNGIIIATTEGISLKGRNHTITITDTNGNKKELKVVLPVSIYYGKEVTNYTCEASGVDKWRVFHVDESDNIYLIADDYVPYANLPTSTDGSTKPNSVNGSNYKAYFTAILSKYTGSAWIRTNTKEEAKNWLSWVNSYPSSTNNNIKAVAYMMDTNKWSSFAGDKAEYAIGGPTLELFCASYKQTHPDRYVECGSMNSTGYKVRWSDGSYTYNISGLTQDDFEEIYIKSSTTKANGMWLASPSDLSTNSVMFATCDGSVNSGNSSNTIRGFRPLVCLKSGVQLVDNGDGTCSIKAAIEAKAEHKGEGQIEIEVTYTENGIAKIEDENGNPINFTNENGIIKATTVTTRGYHYFTIIDNKGIKNKIEIEVEISLVKYYGKEVTNYTCTAEGVDKWRVFHIDESDNIYLIADDYVPYDNLPTSTDGRTKLNQGNTNYQAYLTAIISKYTGSAWIRSNTNEQARNWLSWINSYPNSTNNSIKAVAYMMDTKSWSSFAGEKAEYAIGGPTLELFCASYKVTHPDRWIECNSKTNNGYQVKWSDGSYDTTITGLTQNDFEEIYIKSSTTKANGMWLASPAASANGVMVAYHEGYVFPYSYGIYGQGFRPVVCLKSGVQLVDNGDGKTCSIQ